MIALVPGDTLVASISAGTADAHVSFNDARGESQNADIVNDLADADNKNTPLTASSPTTICTGPVAGSRRVLSWVSIAPAGVACTVTLGITNGGVTKYLCQATPVAPGGNLQVTEHGVEVFA